MKLIRKYKMYDRIGDIFNLRYPEPSLLGASCPETGENGPYFVVSTMTKREIYCLYEDQHRRVWLGNAPGVDTLDKVYEVFFHFLANGYYTYQKGY